MVGNPIDVGIIGVHPDRGCVTVAHMPARQRLLECCITTISCHPVEVVEGAAEGFGIPHAETNVTLVNHPDVGVVAAVKVTQHRELVIRLLETGKMDFCEWPPEAHGATRLQEGPLQSIAPSSTRPALDLKNSTRVVPTFDDEVDLPSLIDAVERSEGGSVDV